MKCKYIGPEERMWSSVQLPLVRQSFPELIASQLVSVQNIILPRPVEHITFDFVIKPTEDE